MATAQTTVFDRDRLRSEILQIEREIEVAEQKRAAAERNKRLALQRGDGSGFSRYNSEMDLHSDTVELLKEKLAPLQAEAAKQARAVEVDSTVAARRECERAIAAAESQLDAGVSAEQRLEASLNEQRQKNDTLRVKLEILRQRDRSAAGAGVAVANLVQTLDRETAVQRTREYRSLTTDARDSRPELALLDGRIGRYCGSIGIDRRVVLEIAGERVTVTRSQLAEPSLVP